MFNAHAQYACKRVRQYAESAYQQKNGRHVVKRAKKAVTLERSLLRKIRKLKIFAFCTKSISVIKVLYKRLMEPENGGHTDTHTK